MKADDVYKVLNEIEQKCFELEKRVSELERWRTKAGVQLADNDYMINVLDTLIGNFIREHKR